MRVQVDSSISRIENLKTHIRIWFDEYFYAAHYATSLNLLPLLLPSQAQAWNLTGSKFK